MLTQISFFVFKYLLKYFWIIIFCEICMYIYISFQNPQIWNILGEIVSCTSSITFPTHIFYDNMVWLHRLHCVTDVGWIGLRVTPNSQGSVQLSPQIEIPVCLLASSLMWVFILIWLIFFKEFMTGKIIHYEELLFPVETLFWFIQKVFLLFYFHINIVI